MWRRAYLILALVRLYFALSPSYIHPDEAFQGPEIIAGQIYGYPVKHTWEFTSSAPIRSIFPLWPVYGLPMLLLKWLWLGHDGEVTPKIVFYTLRVLMFFVSFVLEDWAIHELVSNKRQQRVAIMMVASSYVTWTYQTHTFSNSIETIVVAWSLVLIQRILSDKRRTSPIASAILAMLAVFGTFNRITFPAFLIIPVLHLIPHFAKKPISFLIMVASGLATLFIAIIIDTEFYSTSPVTWSTLLKAPVLTPLNNLKYNIQSSNLALHGVHPRYQHVAANLPMLLGPAFALLFYRPQWTIRIYSAISGLAVLSVFQHQEARFLMPTIPLLLSSVRLPENKRFKQAFMSVWVAFNVVFGLLMGTYHQGGVVLTQFHISGIEDATHALWWKTYSPPIWLLNGKNEVLETHDLMGMKGESMIAELQDLASCRGLEEGENRNGTYLVAPLSATFLDVCTEKGRENDWLAFEKVWQYKTHLNLDDMEFGDDGVWPTLRRVIGRRGLGVWRVTKSCAPVAETPKGATEGEIELGIET